MEQLLRPCALTAIMFLLMRAQPIARLSPLAPALMAAVLCANDSAGACVLGCVLGMIRLPLGTALLMPAVSCALALGIHLLFSLIPAEKLPGEASRASLAAGISALLPPMIICGGDAALALAAFSCGALAACAAPFFLSALRCGFAGERPHADAKAGLYLLAGSCIAGLQAIWPPAAEISAALAVLFAAPRLPLCGIFAGLALWAGGAPPLKMCSLALCSAVCGGSFLPRPWQKSLGMLITALAAHLALGSGALDARWALCAAAIHPLLPRAALGSPRRDSPCDPAHIAREVTADTCRRLNALAEAFSSMADCDSPAPDVPDEQELICEMRSRLCAGCIQYGACWAGDSNRAAHLLCRLIGEAIDRADAPPGMRILFSDGEIPPDVLRVCRRGRMIPDRLGLLLRDFSEKRRSQIKRCENNHILSRQMNQAAEILRDLAGKQASPGADRLAAALENAVPEACGAVALPRGCVALVKNAPWSRDERRRVCAALYRSLRTRYRASGAGTALRLSPVPVLQAETAACCQSGVPGQTCGDSHLVRMLDEHRLMLAICDGMGSGEEARDESLLAIRLLHRFLLAGISLPLALESLNRRLLEGSTRELFSTLDLCLLDLNTGIAEMTKLAACRTILLRGGEMLRVEGGCLPLGIVDGVRPGSHRFRLRPGDLLIMGSDGLMEAGEIHLIEHALRQYAHLPPDQLAEQLVRLARTHCEDDRRDDLTCICARIHRAQ